MESIRIDAGRDGCRLRLRVLSGGSLEIVAGHGSRDKVLLVHGLDPDRLAAKLRKISPKK